MHWEKPEFVELSLACEISSYANAELSPPLAQEQREAKATSEP